MSPEPNQPPMQAAPEATLQQPWPPGYGSGFTPVLRPAPSVEVMVRRAAIWLALAVLAAAIVTAFVSLLQVISIWFEDQWAPVARTVLAILVALVCFYVVRTLMRRPAPPSP